MQELPTCPLDGLAPRRLSPLLASGIYRLVLATDAGSRRTHGVLTSLLWVSP